MKYGEHGYKDAKCCQNCVFCSFYTRNDWKVGRHCQLHVKRVAKLKVCDNFSDDEDDLQLLGLKKALEQWQGRGILIDINALK